MLVVLVLRWRRARLFVSDVALDALQRVAAADELDHRPDRDLAVLLLVVEVADIDQAALPQLLEEVAEARRRDGRAAVRPRHLAIAVIERVECGHHGGAALDRADIDLVLPMRSE